MDPPSQEPFMKKLTAFVAGLGSLVLASSAAAATCESLRTLAIPNVTITTAEVVAPAAPAGRGGARGAGAPAPAAPAAPAPAGQARGGAPAAGGGAAQPPLPEYCRVVMVLKPSSDSNINSELWLPTTTWNGKFMAVGNGGFGGSIQGLNEMRTVIRQGYAAAGNDTGHSAADGPGGMFALGHPEKIVDFAYRAMHEMTVTSKRLINEFYGKPQQFAYYKGCSTGGRQGVMAAQRYPDDFDGIIAGALANRHIQMHTAGSYRAINLARHPDRELTAAKAQLVNRTVMDSCDTLKEGFLTNPRACTVDFKKLACKGADSDSCLTAAQLMTVEEFYGGVKNSKGELIFSGQALGNPINAQRGAIPAIGTGNDTVRIWGFQNANYDWKTFDLDRDMPLINSKVGFVDAVDPDLSKFKARGGKLLLYAGWGDTGITPENTALYYESVLAKMGRNQGDFMRLFMIPGMGHCGGGPGLNTFDSIGALEAWREKNITPTQVTGFNNTTLMTRPVCAYPQAAKYKGTGNIRDAANWSCAN
jgi:feruloyl esterase